MRWALLGIGAITPAVTACLPQTEFRCVSSLQCLADGRLGVCEPVGYCSFPDPACGAGYRYGALSGGYANECVGSGPGIADARPGSADAVEVPPPDAARPSGYCPAGYLPVHGGATYHEYRVTAPNDWSGAMSECLDDGAPIRPAIPDDLAELDAIANAAGSTSAWIGVSDGDIEGYYETVDADPQMFLPWGELQPDDNIQPASEDCVALLVDTLADVTTLYDRDCNLTLVGVCECEYVPS